ncbi:MAG: outer membrane beta-barrel protein [Flavobacteriales bacterium]|nr:outer membrane beta-barrel protein [Flavobacteriales bacterium]
MRQAFLLFAFLPYFLSAQTESSEGQAFQFNGGLIGGATASQIHGDGIGGFNKVGLHLGATIEIGWAENKNIQIGIVYNQKGSKKPPNPTAGDYETWRYRFTYIDIPITTSYSYGIFDLMIGLQPSVLLAAEEDFYGGWLPTGLPIKEYDLGGVLGIRTVYGDHSHVFARVTQSILAIAPRPETPTGTPRWNNRMLNMTVEVGVTYMISKLDL